MFQTRDYTSSHWWYHQDTSGTGSTDIGTQFLGPLNKEHGQYLMDTLSPSAIRAGGLSTEKSPLPPSPITYTAADDMIGDDMIDG